MDPLNSLQLLAKASSKVRLDKCKEDRVACLQQIVTDGVALVSMYMLALYVIDGVVPTVDYLQHHALKYLVLYVTCSYVLRYLDVDYEDALSRGAAVVVAAKFVTVLQAAKPV